MQPINGISDKLTELLQDQSIPLHDEFIIQPGEENVMDEPTQHQDQGVSTPWRYGQVEVEDANDAIRRGASLPPKVPLSDFLGEAWVSGDVTFLYAYTNMGKSILAVQLADEAGRKGHNVLYCDFEMDARAFADRYTDEHTGEHAYLHFKRLKRNLHGVDTKDINETELLRGISASMHKFGATVLIVDNLSYICADLEKGKEASDFLHRLQDMSQTNGWSVLVVAHTPKRDRVRELKLSDLSGSQNLGNFCDAAVAIGAVRGTDEVYIKQTKSRRKYVLTEDNVMVCHIVKDGAMLKFQFDRYAQERTLIADEWQRQQAQERNDFADQVRALRDQGKTIRDIAYTLGVSKSKVERAIK